MYGRLLCIQFLQTLAGQRCVKTVSKPLRFEPLELCLSEEQTPQVIVFSRKLLEKGERLDRAFVRPRQVRYQAALRPDCVAASILKQIGESFWGGRRESNPQRPEPQSGALPVELLPPRLAIITSGGKSVCGSEVGSTVIPPRESAEGGCPHLS